MALQRLEDSVKTLEALDVMQGEILGIPVNLQIHYRLQEAKAQAIELRLLLHELGSKP